MPRFGLVLVVAARQRCNLLSCRPALNRMRPLSPQVDLAARVLYLLRSMASSGVVTSSLAGAQSSRAAQLAWAAGALLLVRCGGGAPLLHPAHVLPVNTVSFGAGLSGQFASGGITDAISRGRSAARGQLSSGANARSYSDGVLTQALVAPGIGPYVSARVGLPEETEAGLTYTGRGIRLDGRYAHAIGEGLALSVGLGATALLLNPDSSGPGPGTDEASGTTTEAEFDLNAKGWGLDAPVLFGYQGMGGLFDLWAGARFGFEQVDGELRSNTADVVRRVSMRRGSAGGPARLPAFRWGCRHSGCALKSQLPFISSVAS